MNSNGPPRGRQNETNKDVLSIRTRGGDLKKDKIPMDQQIFCCVSSCNIKSSGWQLVLNYGTQTKMELSGISTEVWTMNLEREF